MADELTPTFADVLLANERYAASFHLAGLPAQAGQGLAVITCMDSRIEPLAALGLVPGDAKILRNPGGRVTDDVMTALVIAVPLLGVRRVLVMPHTKCAMTQSTEDQLHTKIAAVNGIDTRSLVFGPVDDQEAALREDVERVRQSPFIPDDVEVLGAIYDVDTGRLRTVE